MEPRKSMFSPLVTAIVFSLLLGGVGGYCVRAYTPGAAAGAAPAPGGGGGMMGGGGGGMMGGGGMGGGQNQPQNGTVLARTVRNLDLVEKVQSQGLTPDQKHALAPILASIKSADKLSDQESKDKVDQINKILTDPQKQALSDLTPQRGGRGGGGGGVRGGGPGGVGPGSGGPVAAGPTAMGGGGGGGGMGGGRPDPEKPFASDRNKQALEELIGLVQK